MRLATLRIVVRDLIAHDARSGKQRMSYDRDTFRDTVNANYVNP